ncbi:MAG: NADP-dependent phosphogluconate dehydrogenase [Pyrinomonadaceae bacterium]
MSEAHFGMIGLGVMGRNFLLNVADSGFECVGFDLDGEKVAALETEGEGYSVSGARSLDEFIGKLKSPRNIMLLVPAGKAVDAVIGDLRTKLEPGDLIIDGGNSHFSDTERREKELHEFGFEFMGVGVSGGAKGAREGASIMAGGTPEAYSRVADVFGAAGAKVNGESCAARVGTGSAGHFVKMVHNGIEYAMMQLIAETYDVMKTGLGMSNVEMATSFKRWNEGRLNAFLTEITGKILDFHDEDSGEFLVEKILDTAGQKGTGRWTSEAAMEMGIPVPTIDAAVTMRQISAMKEMRGRIAEVVGDLEEKGLPHADAGESIDSESLEGVLLAGFLIAYAQGFSLLKEASKEKGFELDLAQVATIWRGGCIIRSGLLEKFREVFTADPSLDNLIADSEIAAVIAANTDEYQVFSEYAGSRRIPHLAFSSAFAYFDAMMSKRLPANLIQAQRDFFGSHTYARLDREGIFHTEWETEN